MRAVVTYKRMVVSYDTVTREIEAPDTPTLVGAANRMADTFTFHAPDDLEVADEPAARKHNWFVASMETLEGVDVPTV